MRYGINPLFFLLRILSILTHTQGEGRRRQLILVVYTYGTWINYDSCIYLKFVVIYTSLSLYQLHLEAFSSNTSRIMDSIILGSQQKKLLQFHNISNYPTTYSPQSTIQKNFKDPYVRWQIDLKLL